MGIRSGRSGTRSAQLDQKEETIILRSCDEKRRCLEKENMQGTVPQRESNEDQRGDELTTWKNGLRCRLKKY